MPCRLVSSFTFHQSVARDTKSDTSKPVKVSQAKVNMSTDPDHGKSPFYMILLSLLFLGGGEHFLLSFNFLALIRFVTLKSKTWNWVYKCLRV